MQDNVEDAIQEVQDDADNLSSVKFDKTSVKTTYTSSASDTYSCNYVNGINTYSSGEKRIGTWIDNKPIYRQAFTGTKVSGTNLNINTNLTTIDTLVKFTGVLKSLSGYIYPLPQYETSSINYVMNINKTNGSIQIKTTTGNYSNGDVVIVLEYTKTTD